MEYLAEGIVVAGEFYALKDITEKCNDIKIKNEDSVILQIGWQGRGGEVYEWRVFPKKTAENIKELLVDKEVYFGEIWGKHSEVYGSIEENDFKIVTDKKEVKKFLSQHPSGVDYDHSFIERLLESYEEEGGREYYSVEQGEEYCDDLEQLNKLIN